jgi:predicted PurR-regulated permease PerM
MVDTMNLKLTPGRLLAAAIVVLAFWVVHAFTQALLAACVIAVASWPLYAAFRARLPRSVGQSSGAAIFTVAITVFLLAPMVFACGALLSETHALLRNLAAADNNGLPDWLANTPVFGPWLAAQSEQRLVLSSLTQHADPGALLGWAQSLGQFTFHHALTLSFTVLLLGFLYQEGGSLARELTALLRQAIGDRAERYVDVGARAVRSSVNSMLVVGAFDTFAAALAYAAAGAPRPFLWAAITGVLAAVPFLGYAAVAAMALELGMQGAPTTALWALTLGCAVLLCGDKLVRPMVARDGVRLPFVWVLMGCIGGFGVLGLAGLALGPVVLGLCGELWEERAHKAAGSPMAKNSCDGAECALRCSARCALNQVRHEMPCRK